MNSTTSPSSSPQRHSFDVIVPTYNNFHELRQCIEGLEQQRFRDFRVIVCIDGSTDGTREWLKAVEHTLSFPLLICEHPDGKNHGRNPTRNLALPFLQAEYLCFLDSDVFPDAQLLEQHYHLLTQRPCVSVGDIRYTNTTSNAWAAYAQTRGKNKYPHGAEIPYYYLATGNCAHRTQCFIELGGQDEHITRYGGGDTEYALRLYKRYALPVIFNARATGNSEMNKSLRTALEQMEEFGRTNLHYIHAKHPDVHNIFGLNIIAGHSVRAQILRLLLSVPLAKVCEMLVPFLPVIFANTLLKYCVISRIAKGWKKGNTPSTGNT